MAKQLQVAVFPFQDIILQPNGALPVYITHPTFIQMVKDAIDANMPIAIGLGEPVFDQKGEKIPNMLSPRKTMGIGIPTLVEENPIAGENGISLLLQGIGKVELSEVVQDLPYLICNAEIVEDGKDISTELPHSPLEKLRQKLFEWIEENVSNIAQRKVLENQIKTPAHIIDFLAMFLVKDREIKQIILETHSLVERIKILDMVVNSLTSKNYSGYHAEIIKDFENLEHVVVSHH